MKTRCHCVSRGPYYDIMMLTTRHGEHFEIEKLKYYGRVFDFIIITPLLMIVATALRLAKLAMLIPPKRVYEA